MNAGLRIAVARARRRIWPMFAVLPLAACFGGGESAAPVQSATFVALGTLSGYATSQAIALSADGSVVAGIASTPAGRRQAFRWTAHEGAVGLGFMPGGTYSAAAAISADGSVILGNGDTTSSPTASAGPFLWSAGTGVVRLQPPPNAVLCAGAGMSGDGGVVAGTCLTFNNEAFLWRGGAAPVSLGRFGGGSNQTSSAAAVSKDGSTIVGTGHPVLTGAVVWNTGGAATVVGKLANDATANASAVTRNGSSVVGTSMDGRQVARAFLWTRTMGIGALGDELPPGVTGTYASGVSGDGATVVGWGPTDEGEAALIWQAESGWRTLAAALVADHWTEVPGWQLTRATAISDDGRTIVGFGTNPNGLTEGWLVRLPQ